MLSNLSSIGISRFFISWRSALDNGMSKTLTKTAEISKNVTKNAKTQLANDQPCPLGVPASSHYSDLHLTWAFTDLPHVWDVSRCPRIPSVKKIVRFCIWWLLQKCLYTLINMFHIYSWCWALLYLYATFMVQGHLNDVHCTVLDCPCQWVQGMVNGSGLE